jgi:predicted cupin superfamily sugar epimerase
MASHSFLPPTASELVELLHLIPHPEAGFFLETHRSGCRPMESRGQTGYQVSDPSSLVTTAEGMNRRHPRNRPDSDPRRNALTSIYWCPTLRSPTQPLVQNDSDHVHYYQGGLPFEYFVYDPRARKLESAVVGPDVRGGHVLQLPVEGGKWKCGRIFPVYSGITADYSLIAEAVGPGFDFHDFRFVQESDVDASVAAAATDDAYEADVESISKLLKSFLQRQRTMDEIDEHYTENAEQEHRKQERM